MVNPVRLWLLNVGAFAALFVGLSIAPISTPDSPHPLFWFTVVVTLLCAVFAVGLMLVARHVRQPEMAILGAGLYGASMFPFVHGLTIPGVIWEEETAAASFGAWAGLPSALLIALPVLSRATPWRQLAYRHWQGYCIAAVAAVTAAAVGILMGPNSVPASTATTWWAVAGGGAAFLGAQVLAHRQVDLYRVGRQPASFIAALGFSWVGISSLIWLIGEPAGVAVWAAHLFDAFGVLAATVGLAWAHRNDREITTVFAPVLNRDPAVALRIGITPEILQFVSMLDQKDRSTAGHVTRVAELAIRLGERAGLGADRLRDLGLGALLHDIGKVRVPCEILTKPGRLTEDEFSVMKNHTIWGQEMLAGDNLLAPAGALVRSHHERVDGRGYPDGLEGDEIPVDATLIAVADAWDAMVQTRHYRAGMSEEKARSIFSEHAGTQWSSEAVQLLFAQLDDGEIEGLFTDLVDGDHHICAEALDHFPALVD